MLTRCVICATSTSLVLSLSHISKMKAWFRVELLSENYNFDLLNFKLTTVPKSMTPQSNGMSNIKGSYVLLQSGLR